MGYEQFQQALLEEVRHMVGERYQLQVRMFVKNNGVKKCGMVIRDGETGMAPVLYLETYYRQYQSGVALQHLAKLLLQDYLRIRIDPQVKESFFRDYHRVSGKLYCRLIGAEANEALLKQIPYEEWLDMAVVYYYSVEEEIIENATILIHREHLALWNITEEELKKTAWENTIRDFPPVYKSMQEILREFSQADPGTTEEEKKMYQEQVVDTPLHVLTNTGRMFGAVALCYPGQLKKIGLEIRGNFWVIPSSIHECLILPDDGNQNQKALDQMVREINASQLEPQEVLSDHVYYFHTATGVLRSGSAQAIRYIRLE